jgi:hypothetical protein
MIRKYNAIEGSVLRAVDRVPAPFGYKHIL